MITLKDARKVLEENGLPIRYHTLYAWARHGVFVGEKPCKFATQIGNRWMVDEDKLQVILDGVENYERVRAQPGNSKKKNPAETRGRKPGTKFGAYRKRDASAANRL